MNEKSIGDIIRKAETDYTTGLTSIGKYVQFSQYENIEKIDAYLNSKHTSGETDAMGREKPFFNIVTGAVNIWYRATDIDRKNIRIKATNSKEYIGAFLATVHLQQWMKRESFGQFLNDWGRALARYGSAPLKFIEKGGKLKPSVVAWNRLISDTVDFENNPKIEKLYFTPAQLKKNKNYDQDQVEALLESLSSRKTLGKEQKDNISDFVEIYEIHGELPLSFLTEKDSDSDTYQQQMHVVSFVAKEDKKGNTEYDEFCLLKGKEDRDPYMLTHLIKEDGRSQSIGAVEHLFEAQWMSNYSVKQIKDQLDLASKLIFQTADGSFVGMNALTNIETGDILIHAENAPLTQVANTSHDITSLQSFGTQWQQLAKEIVNTPNAISGGNMPSGTAYRLTAILNQESHSLFELMTENKGLHIEDMFRKFVIPYLKKQMDTTEEIVATLDSYDITQIDSMYIKTEVVKRLNKHVKSAMLKQNGLGGELAKPFDVDAEKVKIQQELNSTGSTRFIKPSEIKSKTWKEIFKDLEWELEVEVTNEQSDKEAIMTTLTTVMQTIGSNPSVLSDPNMRLLFNKILEATGALSPLEMKQQPAPTENAPAPKLPTQSITYKDASPELKKYMESEVGMKQESSPSIVGGGEEL